MNKLFWMFSAKQNIDNWIKISQKDKVHRNTNSFCYARCPGSWFWHQSCPKFFIEFQTLVMNVCIAFEPSVMPLNLMILNITVLYIDHWFNKCYFPENSLEKVVWSKNVPGSQLLGTLCCLLDKGKRVG